MHPLARCGQRSSDCDGGEAERYGGLKSVRILRASLENGVYFVRAEVRFNRDPTAADSPAMAADERMICELRVIREDGKWKLALSDMLP